MRGALGVLTLTLLAGIAAGLPPRTETAAYVGFSDPGVACNGAVPRGVGQACFEPLPGETQVLIALRDSTFAHAAGWAARYDGPTLLEGDLFCDTLAVLLEPGTTQLRVSLQDPASTTVACFPEPGGATAGTITVTWT